MKITLEQARQVIMAAREKAAEVKVPMNIAVVDRVRNLTAYVWQTHGSSQK